MSNFTSSNGFALLGGGIFAREAHLPALASLKSSVLPLKAVYSRSLSTAQTLVERATTLLHLSDQPALYYESDGSNNLDSLLARTDISAVIIVLPITTQPSIILKALKSGKHVLSEKPIAPTVEEGLQLIRTYNEQFKSRGLVWSIAENFEHEPALQHAGELIAQGKLGKVSFFKAVTLNYVDEESKYYKTPWRTVPDYQGGFLLDGGVHTLAALRVLLGRDLTHVSAFSSSNKEILRPHDTIQAIARAGDFHGVIELSFASPTKTKPILEPFTVVGSQGWLAVKWLTKVDESGTEKTYLSVRTVVRAGSNDSDEENETSFPVEGVARELEAFFGTIHGSPTKWGQPIAALKDVAFIQAALHSHGSLVDLSQMLGQEISTNT